MEYKNLNDYELLSYVSEKNEEANSIIFEKYKPLIYDKANKLHIYCKNHGVDISDLVQEGMLGLNDAIKHFNESHDTTFYTYASKCINSRMVSCIIRARRIKHKILNESVFVELFDEDESNHFGKNLADNSYNPEEVLLEEEGKREIYDMIDDCLTDIEKEVINLKIVGFKYQEIADMLGKDRKYVDNCMQKIRNKLKVELNKI